MAQGLKGEMITYVPVEYGTPYLTLPTTGGLVVRQLFAVSCSYSCSGQGRRGDEEAQWRDRTEQMFATSRRQRGAKFVAAGEE